MAGQFEPSRTQERAIERLRKALDNCDKSGLQGGVYDGQFLVWDISEDAFDKNENFRGHLMERVFTNMHLDGGAGV